jgi:hypothetical protein
MSAALGTTEADAVVRLGLMGATQYEREERLAKLSRAQTDSILSNTANSGQPPFPPAKQARQAVLDARAHD